MTSPLTPAATHSLHTSGNLAKPRLVMLELRLMGDAVMSLPFLRAAQERYDVHVCCSAAAASVFRLVLPPDRVHAWQPPWLAGKGMLASLPAFLRMARHLARLDPACIVCSWCEPRSLLLMRLTGAPVRVGFPSHPDNFYGRHLAWRQRQLRTGQRLERLGRLLGGAPLLTQPLQRRDYAQHHVVDWQQIAAALELTLDTTTPCLRPTAPAPAHHAGARRRLAIHPGASEVSKRWPLERFIALAEGLSARYDIEFIEPPELPLAAAVRGRFPVVTTRSIAKLVDVLSTVDALIGNDAGVGHLADALGKPVIAIFISSEVRHFAPHGSRRHAISFDGACDERPCFGRCTKPSLECHRPLDFDAVAPRVDAALSELFG